MYTCKLFGVYPRNPRIYEGFPKKVFFSYFKKVYIPLSKFSNRIIISGLNNGRSKIGVVSMSTPT